MKGRKRFLTPLKSQGFWRILGFGFNIVALRGKMCRIGNGLLSGSKTRKRVYLETI